MKVAIHGNITVEFRGEVLNAFNTPHFNPGSTAGIPLGMTTNFTSPGGPMATGGTPISNAIAATSVDAFRLTQLLGDNQSRTAQLIWRVRW